MDNYDKEVEYQRKATHISEVMQTDESPEMTPTGSQVPQTIIHNHYHSAAEQAPVRSERPTASRSTHGWVWMVIAVVAIIVICIGFYSLTGQTAKLNGSVQEQTSAIREQTGVLGSIRDGISSIAKSIQEAIIRFFK
jgi:cell division protein FtsL